MSKHPTSELSPRDIAAMDYGHQYMRVINAFKQRNFVSLSFRGFVRDEIKIARDSRERIFRLCGFCKHTGHGGSSWCEHAYDYVHMKEDLACTCQHYEERREK